MSMVNIYILASGAIAVPVIRELTNSSVINICGISTQPDKPVGRKKILTPTPVGQWADENNISCERCTNVNDPEFIKKLKSLKPDIILVFAFGQLLKEEILSLPSNGCINLHASILPKYRGAAPINAAILEGDAETGVSVMQMEKGLDTGPVYDIFKIDISDNDTAESLENKLAELAAEITVGALLKIANDGQQPVPQDESKATHVGKISKNDGLISWNSTAKQVIRKIRAFTPWPGVFFRISTPKGDKKIQVTECEAEECIDHPTPGTVLQADKYGWTIACEKSVLKLLRIIPEGKKEMKATDFLLGCQVEAGSVL